MCEMVFAPGSRDLAVGMKRCANPTCAHKRPVPLNDAALRQSIANGNAPDDLDAAKDLIARIDRLFAN